MITTIDKAGRVVIPKVLRQKFHMLQPTDIEILSDHDGLKIRIPQAVFVIEDKEGVLVQRAETPAAIDATAFINQQRDARSLEFDSEGGRD